MANEWGGIPATGRWKSSTSTTTPRRVLHRQRHTAMTLYDRKGPKVYVGEYAVTQGCGQGNLRGALGEAAFMTGMERNTDVVVMASYAPLFANINYKSWNPDLINFDSSRVYGTALLLRAEDVQREPRRRGAARFDRCAAGHGRGADPRRRSAWAPGRPRPNSRTSRSPRGDKMLFQSDFRQGHGKAGSRCTASGTSRTALCSRPAATTIAA